MRMRNNKQQEQLHYRICPRVRYPSDPCECDAIAESRAAQPVPFGTVTNQDFIHLGRLQMNMCKRCGVLVGDLDIHINWHNNPWGLK